MSGRQTRRVDSGSAATFSMRAPAQGRATPDHGTRRRFAICERARCDVRHLQVAPQHAPLPGFGLHPFEPADFQPLGHTLLGQVGHGRKLGDRVGRLRGLGRRGRGGRGGRSRRRLGPGAAALATGAFARCFGACALAVEWVRPAAGFGLAFTHFEDSWLSGIAHLPPSFRAFSLPSRMRLATSTGESPVRSENSPVVMVLGGVPIRTVSFRGYRYGLGWRIEKPPFNRMVSSVSY